MRFEEPCVPSEDEGESEGEACACDPEELCAPPVTHNNSKLAETLRAAARKVERGSLDLHELERIKRSLILTDAARLAAERAVGEAEVARERETEAETSVRYLRVLNDLFASLTLPDKDRGVGNGLHATMLVDAVVSLGRALPDARSVLSYDGYAAARALAANHETLERVLELVAIELAAGVDPESNRDASVISDGLPLCVAGDKDSVLSQLRLQRNPASKSAEVQLPRAQCFFDALVKVLVFTQTTTFVSVYPTSEMEWGRAEWLRLVARVVSSAYGGGLLVRDHERAATLVQALVQSLWAQKVVPKLQWPVYDDSWDHRRVLSVLLAVSCACRALTRMWPVKTRESLTREEYDAARGVWVPSMIPCLKLLRQLAGVHGAVVERKEFKSRPLMVCNTVFGWRPTCEEDRADEELVKYYDNYLCIAQDLLLVSLRTPNYSV
jgi:hypothetical protein